MVKSTKKEGKEEKKWVRSASYPLHRLKGGKRGEDLERGRSGVG